MKVRLNALETIVLFFQAEDGIRDWSVTGVQTVLFRSLFWPPDGPYTDTQSLYCGEGSYSLKACICRGHSGSRNRSEERRVGKECRARRAESAERTQCDTTRGRNLAEHCRREKERRGTR